MVLQRNLNQVPWDLRAFGSAGTDVLPCDFLKNHFLGQEMNLVKNSATTWLAPQTGRPAGWAGPVGLRKPRSQALSMTRSLGSPAAFEGLLRQPADTRASLPEPLPRQLFNHPGALATRQLFNHPGVFAQTADQMETIKLFAGREGGGGKNILSQWYINRKGLCFFNDSLF